MSKSDETVFMSIGDNGPSCESCIFAWEEATECRVNAPVDAINPQTRIPYGFDRYPPTTPGGCCGRGVFFFGEPPNRTLISYQEWWEQEIAKSNQL